MPYTNRYEHSYGISLLDDLHNLFPEILYDPVRFQTPLVQFLRERTSELFDVEFARNRAYYRLYIQPRAATPPPRARPTSPPPIVRQTRGANGEPWFGVVNRANHGGSIYTVPIVTTTIDTGIQDTLNLFTSALLGGLGTSTELQDLLTPVPVVPTSQQIADATILSSIEPPADVVCTICQDHAPPSGSHEWRILRSCTHRFHKQCIDTWFQSNVHCPVCRHDIRE